MNKLNPRDLTDEQIVAAIAAARMTEQEKAVLREQAIERRDPNARFAVLGLIARQNRR